MGFADFGAPLEYGNDATLLRRVGYRNRVMSLSSNPADSKWQRCARTARTAACYSVYWSPTNSLCLEREIGSVIGAQAPASRLVRHGHGLHHS